MLLDKLHGDGEFLGLHDAQEGKPEQRVESAPGRDRPPHTVLQAAPAESQHAGAADGIGLADPQGETAALQGPDGGGVAAQDEPVGVAAGVDMHAVYRSEGPRVEDVEVQEAGTGCPVFQDRVAAGDKRQGHPQKGQNPFHDRTTFINTDS
ncbi:MAG TPA: hypothetical protein DCF48_05955 [Rikenellaceae bacterium]|nr:hypothetical protein [Rikenellaceae bacterium]